LSENETEICLIIRKEFLERFYPHDGVIVGGEPLNLRWGKPICEEIDGWPSWVADLRLKKVPKEQLEQSIREINWAGDFQKELN